MRRFGAVGAVATCAVLAIGVSRAQDFAASCAALSAPPDGAGRVTEASFVGLGVLPTAGQRGPGDAPAHCLVRGRINERTGIDGKPYWIGYELRLPESWNGKFLFQGGGGMDGVLRTALGVLPGGPTENGLGRGFAVVSTDAGHLQEPGPLGPFLFGLDPQARLDKGTNSIPTTDRAARAVIGKLYGRAPARSYFVGCSNGGRQAMAATQLFPSLFDGVIAGAPAYRVPYAAMDAAFGTQQLARIAPPLPDGTPDLGNALSAEELKTVADSVLERCDAADGLKDGMVFDTAACRVDMRELACKPGQNSACLPGPKTEALAAILAGAKNKAGSLLYSRWVADPGMAAPGWTAWRLGRPGASPPTAINAGLIPGSLAYVFNAPPERPTDLYAYTLAYDLDRDPPKVEKPADGFPPGRQFETATSADLDLFRGRGGKILFHHGTADPIFSALDTVAYLDDLGVRYGADTGDFARLFLVPGMNHCGGGPTTDNFDALAALETWVDTGEAPQSMVARASAGAPWPGRSRLLCPYPKVGRYKGAGDPESAVSFECR